MPALGYIVGRKAALPDGTSVRIELTGPVHATYLVQVDGRAQVVSHLDGDATVTLRMPTMLFLRLTGGRTEAASQLGYGLEIEGDQQLGLHLASNMAMTI